MENYSMAFHKIVYIHFNQANVDAREGWKDNFKSLITLSILPSKQFILTNILTLMRFLRVVIPIPLQANDLKFFFL